MHKKEVKHHSVRHMQNKCKIPLAERPEPGLETADTTAARDGCNGAPLRCGGSGVAGGPVGTCNGPTGPGGGGKCPGVSMPTGGGGRGEKSYP